MQPNDILRGCLFAYLAGLTPHVIWLGLIAAPEGPVAILGLGVLAAVIGGVFAMIATVIAFGLFAWLAARKARLNWWAAPAVAIALALLALSYLIPSAPDPEVLAIYGVALGLVTGVSFWLGAAGRVRTVHLGQTPPQPRPYGVR